MGEDGDTTISTDWYEEGNSVGASETKQLLETHVGEEDEKSDLISLTCMSVDALTKSETWLLTYVLEEDETERTDGWEHVNNAVEDYDDWGREDLNTSKFLNIRSAVLLVFIDWVSNVEEEELLTCFETMFVHNGR